MAGKKKVVLYIAENTKTGEMETHELVTRGTMRDVVRKVPKSTVSISVVQPKIRRADEPAHQLLFTHIGPEKSVCFTDTQTNESLCQIPSVRKKQHRRKATRSKVVAG